MKKWHLWTAALTGIVVVAIMMAREFDWRALARMDMSWQFFSGVTLAVGCFVVQNLMLTLRFRHLTGNRLSVAQCFRIDALCEFTSAATPSAVGGSSVAFVYLNREGVSMGRSIFTMFATLMADEAFLAVSCIAIYLIVPSNTLFCLGSMVDAGNAADGTILLRSGIRAVFLCSTGVVAVWTVILYYLLLHRPQAFGGFLKLCCKMPFINRFKAKAEKFGNEMTMASTEARKERIGFWGKLAAYTSAAWMSRFATVLAILWAFDAHGNMLLAWFRQWVIWMISIISPTPGGSGVAEIMFKIYYSDFMPEASLAILAAMIWRMISYYPYLIMGVVVLPKWIKRNDY